MATNAAYGFRMNGIEKLDYQHGDGWIDSDLVEGIIQVIKLVDTEKMKECFNEIVVDNGEINFDSTGNLIPFIIGEEKSMVDGNKYYTDYDYVLDLDKEILEVKHHGNKTEMKFEEIRDRDVPVWEIIHMLEGELEEHEEEDEEEECEECRCIESHCMCEED